MATPTAPAVTTTTDAQVGASGSSPRAARPPLRRGDRPALPALALAFTLSALGLLVAGCPSEEDSPNGADASLSDRGRRDVPDEPRSPDGGDLDDTGGGGDTSEDLGRADLGRADAIDELGTDDSGAPDLPTGGDDAPPGCEDGDNDGYAAVSCGGTDCNDANPRVNPGFREICDFLDNDCSEGVNQGIDCTFFAHSGTNLYRLDPFRGSVSSLGSVPGLLDIDTHPNGTLYGVSTGALWRYESSTSEWVSIQSLSLPGSTNGMAIDLDGRAYVTSGNALTRIDLRTGGVTSVGNLGGTFVSSGDCVINKDNSLYMSSRSTGGSDVLVAIDGETAEATAIGPIGFDEVYALTAAWGFLFGLTNSGEVIIISEDTGEAELITTVTGVTFFGAASTPER
jgi:hypothetical protein